MLQFRHSKLAPHKLSRYSFRDTSYSALIYYIWPSTLWPSTWGFGQLYYLNFSSPRLQGLQKGERHITSLEIWQICISELHKALTDPMFFPSLLLLLFQISRNYAVVSVQKTELRRRPIISHFGRDMFQRLDSPRSLALSNSQLPLIWLRFYFALISFIMLFLRVKMPSVWDPSRLAADANDVIDHPGNHYLLSQTSNNSGRLPGTKTWWGSRLFQWINRRVHFSRDLRLCTVSRQRRERRG